MIYSEEFKAYYLSLTIPKPTAASFVTMDIRFQLGIFMDFFKAKGMLLIASTYGYKFRRYTQPDITDRQEQLEKQHFIIDVFFDGEQKDIFEVYSIAIEHGQRYISQPPF